MVDVPPVGAPGVRMPPRWFAFRVPRRRRCGRVDGRRLVERGPIRPPELVQRCAFRNAPVPPFGLPWPGQSSYIGFNEGAGIARAGGRE